ncbi:MAG: DUF433 domain-containing protein [SAR324 cluster bacterium]|nr:DUF433 domain-containing protein [SAR324 cluster bacterium]
MSRTDENVVNLFNTGLYTVGDVSRLTHIHPQRISRWMRGYSYSLSGEKRSKEPIWQPETPRVDGMITMGFNDLLEIRFVNALREYNISLKKIRNAVTELGNILGKRYPFSSRTVFVIGRDLITQLHDDEGRPLFIELSGSRQTIFYETTLPALEKGLIFEGDIVGKWYPDIDGHPNIVINPRVLFGAPVIEGTRLSTNFVFGAYKAEGTYENVAYWYGIGTEAIRQAVSFHRQHSAA